MKNKLIWLIAFIIIAHTGVSQSSVNRYFIYFTDKDGGAYPYSIANPEQFLTQRALDRRNKQDIAITETDLPVDPAYIQGLRNEGVDVFFTSKWLNGALVNADISLLDNVSQLSFVDSIAWVADTTRLSYEKDIPDDPTSFAEPGSVNGDSDIQLMMLGADHMHADNIKGQGMLIAVLDNGFNGLNRHSPFKHLWENDQIIATRDFVQNSGNVYQFGDHGTSVFSTIGSKYESSSGNLFGIAYEANFILCITEDNQAENTLEEYNWVIGAEFADSLGADVINCSLGYRFFDIEDHDYTVNDLDGETAIISIGAKIAAEKGMVVVTSAGNSGDEPYPRNLISPPADGKGILTVGSVNPDFSYSEFSSVGNTTDGRIKPDVAAFGSATAVVRGSGSIQRGSGTSFASPLIAGLAAGIWQANPDWTSKEVIAAIKKSGHRNFSPDSLRGWGVPNYTYAVKGEKALDVVDILEDKVTIFPNPFYGDTLYLTADGKFNEGMSIRILDPKGSLIFNKDFGKKDIRENMELNIDGSQQGVYFLFLQIGTNQKIVKLINF